MSSEFKKSAILQMEIDYLRDELAKVRQENTHLKERLNKRKRIHGTKVFSVIIKSEENDKRLSTASMGVYQAPFKH